jgi:hypothetical protein
MNIVSVGMSIQRLAVLSTRVAFRTAIDLARVAAGRQRRGAFRAHAGVGAVGGLALGSDAEAFPAHANAYLAGSLVALGGGTPAACLTAEDPLRLIGLEGRVAAAAAAQDGWMFDNARRAPFAAARAVNVALSLGGEPTVADWTLARGDGGQIVHKIPAAGRADAIGERSCPRDQDTPELVSPAPRTAL